MSDNFDTLLEQSVRAQEKSTAISQALLEVSKRMEENVKSLNDNFVLHSLEAKNIGKDIVDIKTTLLKYLRSAIIALLIAVGGTTIVKLLLDSKIL